MSGQSITLHSRHQRPIHRRLMEKCRAKSKVFNNCVANNDDKQNSIQRLKRWALLCGVLSMLGMTSNAAYSSSTNVDIPPNRVITIGGAVTEILYELGLADTIIGSDTTSYYPEAAKNTPKVGYMRALSAEGILALRADVVFAAAGAGPPKTLAQLQALDLFWVELPTVVTLEDLYQNINTIGDIMSVTPTANRLVQRLQQQNVHLAEQVKASTVRPKVLFIMQHTGTPMVAGRDTSADRILTLAGADNVAHTIEGYKPLTAEAMVRLNPDWIVTTELGLDKTGGVERMLALPGIGLTNANSPARIISMDGLLLLGFGPRTIEAAQLLRSYWHD